MPVSLLPARRPSARAAPLADSESPVPLALKIRVRTGPGVMALGTLRISDRFLVIVQNKLLEMAATSTILEAQSRAVNRAAAALCSGLIRLGSV